MGYGDHMSEHSPTATHTDSQGVVARTMGDGRAILRAELTEPEYTQRRRHGLVYSSSSMSKLKVAAELDETEVLWDVTGLAADGDAAAVLRRFADHLIEIADAIDGPKPDTEPKTDEWYEANGWRRWPGQWVAVSHGT